MINASREAAFRDSARLVVVENWFEELKLGAGDRGGLPRATGVRASLRGLRGYVVFVVLGGGGVICGNRVHERRNRVCLRLSRHGRDRIHPYRDPELGIRSGDEDTTVISPVSVTAIRIV
jgi:hypothetical protein